jgi:succinate dehydrogenase / fumarate reductase, flavoprotein subunit
MVNRVCRGICAMDLRSMEVRTFPADAIIIATGGNGAIFGKSTNSVVCTGSAQSALYQQGCLLREWRVHSGASHLHSGRGQVAVDVGIGARRGRARVGAEDSGDKRDPKAIPENERWYFLEEWYPKYGNLVPRDIATRAILRLCSSTTLASTASRWSIST